MPFRKGLIKLNDVKLKNGVPEFYNVTFVGETINLKTFLREEELQDLAWLDNFSHINNFQARLNSLKQGQTKTVDGVTYDKAIIIPLISHTQRFFYDSSGNFDRADNIAWKGPIDPLRDKRGVFPEDVKYAIKVFLIIKALEKRYTTANGFRKNLVFSEDFFYKENPALENLYLWCHRKKGKEVGPGQRDIVNFSENCQDIGVGGCNTILNPPAPWSFGNLEYNQGFMFWIPQQNTERMFMKWTIVPATGYLSTRYDIRVILQEQGIGEEIIAETNENQGTTSIEVAWDNFTATDRPFTPNVDLIETFARVNSLDDFAFGYELEIQWSYNDINGTRTTASARFSSTQTSIDLLEDFTPTLQVPKIKNIDFLTGIFKLFNLTAYVDEITDTIIVQPLDDFYASSTQTFDLTDIVESASHQVNEALPFTDIDFKYKEPKTILATQFNERNNAEYGNLTYSAKAT